MANVIGVRYYLSSQNRNSQHIKKDLNKFWYVYVFVYIRIAIYFIILVYTLCFLPCTLRSILNKRRRRLLLLEGIRRNRGLNNLPIPEENLQQPLLFGQNIQNEVVPPPVYLPYAPVPQEERNRINLFNERMRNILVGDVHEPIDADSFDLLNRVSY